jgi:hypothetical protein
MNTFPKTAALGTLGLPSGDHWVRIHVEDHAISFEVAASLPLTAPKPDKPTGFVQRWGGSARRQADDGDAWLAHINSKHLR